MAETAELVRDIMVVIALGLGLLVPVLVALSGWMVWRQTKAAGPAAKRAGRNVAALPRVLGLLAREAVLPRGRPETSGKERRHWRPGGTSAVALGGGLAIALAEAQRAPSGRPEPERERPRLAKAEDPQEESGRGRLIGIGKQLKDEYTKDDLGTWAASLAYRFFLALFPFFIFLAALAGFVAAMLAVEDPTQQVIELLGGLLPPDAADLIGQQLGQVVAAQNPGLLSFGLIGALWAASSGVQSLMRAMNNAYGVPETRPLLKKYGLSLGLTLLAGLFVIAATVVFFTGQFFAVELLEWVGLEGWAATLVAWLRWPVIIVLLMVAIGVLYWACPNIKLPFKFITPGAVLFVIAWLVASGLFAIYVANFGNYDATYGALGGVVVMLIWFYATSLLLLIGAELNAILDERAEPESMAERRQAKHAEAAAKGK